MAPKKRQAKVNNKRSKRQRKQSYVQNMKKARASNGTAQSLVEEPAEGVEGGFPNWFINLQVSDLEDLNEMFYSHSQTCSEKMKVSGFSVRSRKCFWKCEVCKGEIEFETSKQVKINGYTVREHGLRQVLKSKLGGAGFSQSQRMSVTKSISHAYYDRIVSKILCPVMKELWDEHVEKAIRDYRSARDGGDPDKVIPCMVELDGRFNKCRGWNSLDGHLIGTLYDQKDGKAVKIPIFLRAMHRKPPCKNRTSNFSQPCKTPGCFELCIGDSEYCSICDQLFCATV